VLITQKAKFSNLTPTRADCAFLGPRYITHMEKTGISDILDTDRFEKYLYSKAIETLYEFSFNQLPVLLDLATTRSYRGQIPELLRAGFNSLKYLI
jgi:hypothetical protein